MPGGCGEQNMINFAPDVFITLYLKKANKLDEKTKTTAYKHIRSGYSNQLTYRESDGSYSAFGRGTGSTWLTAFVVKCFKFASLLDPDFVQNEVIAEGLKFIIESQTDNGVFQELGNVIDTRIQGGVNGGVTMTAYVLISLVENQEQYAEYGVEDMDATNARVKAVEYLEKNVIYLDDKYALAIATYALKLSKSVYGDFLLTRLEGMAERDGVNKYWHTQERFNGHDCYISQSSDIEMTSYILLAHALNGLSGLADAMPIVRWLVSQRNLFGGYYSTQDTVIAIQALSQIAGLFGVQVQDLSIADASNAKIFDINSENDLVLQTTEIKDFENDVEVSVTGEGLGILQLTTKYNVYTKVTDDEPFKLNVTVIEINQQKSNLRVCARINVDRQDPFEDVGMFLITVALANGFSVDIHKERVRNMIPNLIEMDGTDVNLYYSTVRNGDQCFTLTLERYVEIARMSPQVITAIDYYNPDRVSYREYVIPSLATSTVCDVCGSKCSGCIDNQ